VRVAERSDVLRRLRDRAPAALAVAAFGLGAGAFLVVGASGAPDRHPGGDHLAPAQAYAAAATTLHRASAAAPAAAAALPSTGTVGTAAGPVAQADPAARDEGPERIRGPPAA
jgi:hypothetical protein